MAAARQVVQIVSHFFPASCGVGDYARLLASEWQRRQGIQSRFLVADAQWSDTLHPEGWEARRLRRSSQENWADLVGAPPAGVVLQYSGYGYARRGAPLWLVRTLRSLRRRLPEVPVITMFHEVAAKGPIHTSSFWMRPLQLWVAKRLRQLSDAVLTNCTMNVELLREAAPCETEDIRIIQVISNFGELSAVVPVRERHSQLVVFTSNFGGRTPAPDFWKELTTAVVRHAVTNVVLIGRHVKELPELPFPVQQLGFLEAEQISGILGQSRFGYAFLGTHCLGKSGIFAAFAGHAVIPIIPVNEAVLPDGLTAGIHYLRSTGASGESEFENVQTGILQWYLQHNLKATAAVYVDILDRIR